MKKNGISLIVLVITIIIMIILAATIIISLESNGVINAAEEAVAKENVSNLQHAVELKKTEIITKRVAEKQNITVTNENILDAFDIIIREEVAVDSDAKYISSVRKAPSGVCYKLDVSKIDESAQESTGTYVIDEKCNVYYLAQGEEKEYLKIYNIEDLKEFRDSVNNGTDYSNTIVLLMNDIDLAGDYSNQWTPIGSYEKPFNGTFNGNDHKITGLFISDQRTDTYIYRGLFGAVDSGKLCNLKVSVKYMYCWGGTGSLVGFAKNSKVENITTLKLPDTEKIVCNFNTGGIIGSCQNTEVNNVINNIDIMDSQSDVGGIIGCAWGKTRIKNAKNYGTINALSETGGIIGYAYEGIIISDVENYGNIDGKESTKYATTELGGIIGTAKVYSGYEESNITNAKNYGTITGDSKLGGIVGSAQFITIKRCINYGPINAKIGEDIGGILGEYYLGYNGKIIECGNEKTAVITNIREGGSSYSIGGIAGTDAIVISSYNKADIISDNSTCIGGILAQQYFADETVSIINSYNTGNIITSTGTVGGVLGSTKQQEDYITQIKNCYTVGSLPSSATTIGSIVGNGTKADVMNCYYSTSQPVSGNGGTVNSCLQKTQEEMKTTNFCTNLGDAFTNDTAGINDGYPILKWELEIKR